MPPAIRFAHDARAVVETTLETHMSLFTDESALDLLRLDEAIFAVRDFDALSRALVHWAREAGLDGAFVGRPDADGWLRPGPFAGQDMQAYLECTRISILDAEGCGAASLAWRSRRVQTATLTKPADDLQDAPTEHSAKWRVSATVPLSDTRECVGLLYLFSRDPDVLLGPQWALVLSHICLVSTIALDRMRQNTEQAQLRAMPMRDPLTGLPNMAALACHFELALPRASRAGVPLVIGLLDLDKFKPVNDMFGHEAGDRILQVTALRLREQLRASDLVARRGGDEFVIVLECLHDPRDALVPLLERVHARLTQPIEIGGTSWHCGLSLGLALCPEASINTLDDALSEADRALRASKMRRGGHWWCWASLADSRATQDVNSANDHGPYGPQWACELASLSAQLQRNAAAVVNDFYERLDKEPKPRRILDGLSGSERQRLKALQIQNLFALADPNLTEADHRTTALRVGRIHAMVGLDREELLRSRAILATTVYGHLESVSREALQVFARRLNLDVIYQAEAYQHLQGERLEALQDIARYAWNSEGYADLITRITDVLGACDEFAGVAIIRPDQDGIFRVEAASGHVLEGQPVAPDCGPAPQDQGLLDAVWRTGKIERSINISTDPRMAAWRSVAAFEGLRSSVAIPVCPFGKAPFAILTLHSRFPGGYASADQTAFIDLLQTLLAFAMGRIASEEGRIRTISHTTRREWRALLQSDALQMHCQPILDLKTGQVTKVEMLARLNEGSRLLTPHEFFPALTPDDFLELYIRGLRQTLSRRSAWLRDGVELDVSLNLPPSALLDVRYFEATREALAMYDCPPQVLTLELLEAEAIPLGADVVAELGRFKSLGVMLAEDDLGAGHSSLLRLRELPFDWVKIDRDIVGLAGQNASDVLSFIYQLTRLGHSLGKSVIVEGIESDALLEACAILNVDAVQGYAIARPMPCEELIEWMGAWSARKATPDSPRTALGKLASLLLWEERLHLIGSKRNTSMRMAEMVPVPTDASAIHSAESLPRSLCGDCELISFFNGIDSIMSGAEARRSATQALLHAALTHGPRDATYREARQGFISALTIDSLQGLT